MENILGPAVVERAMSISESFGERPHGEIVRAHKALTHFIFGWMYTRETSDHRLAISGLAYLKQRATRSEAQVGRL